MLGSHLERELERALGGSRAVVVEPDAGSDTEERRVVTELAVGRALNRPVRVHHRPDVVPRCPERGSRPRTGPG